MFTDKPIYSYIGMVLAVVAIVAGVLFSDYGSMAWTLAGLFGFGSVAALRAQIDSKGWKTYAMFVVVVLVTLLQIFGVIDPTTAHALMIAFAPILGITVQQALAKSPTASIKKLAA